MPTDQPSRCQAKNKEGEPCSAQHWKDGYCRWHHPDLATERKAWSAKGGSSRSNSARARKKLSGDVRDLVGVKAMLLEGMEQTKAGAMEPGVLTALSTAARAVVAVSGAGELETRLADIERSLGINGSRIA